MNPLVNAWDIHNRIHLYLLESLSQEQWSAKAEKIRSTQSQFAHIHNVRLMWLKSANPSLLEGLEKLENASPEATRDALVSSGEAISTLLSQTLASGERIKGFKPNTEAFLCYLISHESHHRGQIEAGLRQTGTPISDKISFGLWEWGVR